MIPQAYRGHFNTLQRAFDARDACPLDLTPELRLIGRRFARLNSLTEKILLMSEKQQLACKIPGVGSLIVTGTNDD